MTWNLSKSVKAALLCLWAIFLAQAEAAHLSETPAVAHFLETVPVLAPLGKAKVNGVKTTWPKLTDCLGTEVSGPSIKTCWKKFAYTFFDSTCFRTLVPLLHVLLQSSSKKKAQTKRSDKLEHIIRCINQLVSKRMFIIAYEKLRVMGQLEDESESTSPKTKKQREA